MRHFDLQWLFEPTTLRQRKMKWLTIILANVIGVSAVISLVLDVSYLQRVCRDAVYVEAVVSASRIEDNWVGDPQYERRLSYEFNSKQYVEIHYDSHRSSNLLEDNGKTIRVMIDQYNPTQLAEHIVNIFGCIAQIILFSVGMALLVYGILAEKPAFRMKRLALQQRKYPHLTSLDHWPDVGLMASILFIVLWITLILIFPDAYRFYG